VSAGGGANVHHSSTVTCDAAVRDVMTNNLAIIIIMLNPESGNHITN